MKLTCMKHRAYNRWVIRTVANNRVIDSVWAESFPIALEYMNMILRSDDQ